MMGLPAIKLDTLSIAKDLENSGVPGIQAQSQVRATVKVINMLIEEKLVTKQDLNESESRLSGAINHVDSRLSCAIHDLDKRVISIEERLATLATKQDLAQLDKHLTGAMSEMDKRMTSFEHQMKSLQLTLSLRMGGMIAAGVIILSAILNL